MKHTERACDGCGKMFAPVSSRHRFHSWQCQRATLRTLPGEKRATGETGAISELAASVDLMIRGYEVFRALSPHASCDLIAISPGSLLRIEVRSARIGKHGGLSFPKSDRSRDGLPAFDHYAIVTYDGTVPHVDYQPPLSGG
jgi:hypothetical protein